MLRRFPPGRSKGLSEDTSSILTRRKQKRPPEGKPELVRNQREE
jgi:hypothetical protein